MVLEISSENIEDKAIKEIVDSFGLWKLERPSSEEKKVSLSKEWLELIKNNDYFFTVEDVFKTRYILKTGVLPPDKVIEIWKKYINLDKNIGENFGKQILPFLDGIIEKYKIKKFGLENGEKRILENKRDDPDFAEAVRCLWLPDMGFVSYKQVYIIPYDVLVKNRKKFNEFLIGRYKVYPKDDNLYYRGYLITPEQLLYLNVVCDNTGKGVIACFTPAGILEKKAKVCK